jgi:uncharacterized protein YihD (DUF1040 family)
MASTRTDVIQDALLRAEEIQDRTVELAKAQLYEIFSNNVEDSISKVLSEAVTVGKDQPAGYDQDADQDALAFGSSKHKGAGKEDINKGGKGPQKLEGSIEFEDDMDEMEDFGGEDDNLEAIPISENDFNFDEAADEDMDEAEEMETVDETADNDADDMDEAEDKDETVALQETVKKLSKELKEYKRAFNILKTKFDEVNLLNAKVNESTKYLRYPGLTMNQKEAIVEAFDRARSIREVGLVSRTLAEGIRTAVKHRRVPTTVVKSASSRRMNESFSADAKRLQELAGI